jgi:hypothetical protein
VQAETADTACLVIRNPEVHHCGFYHVVVSNDAGAVQSARACMIVQPEAAQHAHGRFAASGASEPHASRGGKAAARRRRMLDGAAARSSSHAEGPTHESSHAESSIHELHDDVPADGPLASLLTSAPQGPAAE